MPFGQRRMHFKRSDKTNERDRKLQGQSGLRAVVGVPGGPLLTFVMGLLHSPVWYWE